MDLISIFDAIQSDAADGASIDPVCLVDRDVQDFLSKFRSLPDLYQDFPMGVRWWLANIMTAADSTQAMRSYQLFERHFSSNRTYIDAAQSLLALKAEAAAEENI